MTLTFEFSTEICHSTCALSSGGSRISTRGSGNWKVTPVPSLPSFPLPLPGVAFPFLSSSLLSIPAIPFLILPSIPFPSRQLGGLGSVASSPIAASGAELRPQTHFSTFSAPKCVSLGGVTEASATAFCYRFQRAWSVCIYICMCVVCHTRAPCSSRWTEWDASHITFGHLALPMKLAMKYLENFVNCESTFVFLLLGPPLRDNANADLLMFCSCLFLFFYSA